MQENTMSYYGKPLGWIGNFKDEDGKKFSPAFQLIFRIMISCTAETKTFSVITVQTIQRETGFSERNIIRAFEFFQKRGFVRRCKQWFSGCVHGLIIHDAHCDRDFDSNWCCECDLP